MNELDTRIREALAAEDAKLIELMEKEPSLGDLITDTFRSRQRWLAMILFVAVFGFAVFFFYAAYQAFDIAYPADNTADFFKCIGIFQ